MKYEVGDKVQSTWDTSYVGFIEKITEKFVFIRWNHVRTGKPSKTLKRWNLEDQKRLRKL